MTAYYNENDKAAAHVLKHMIDIGVIAPGVVDTRSIKEVTPDDVKGYTQVHLFAGGGFWSCAARLAGWPDDEQLWTASCPCQPFSAAGQGAGTDDPRHLWPDVYRLARAIRPAVIMGEQVAQKAGYGWFDGVRTDMAREGYASRSVDFPACSVDAPHQRNRQYWVSMVDCEGSRFEGEFLDAERISTEHAGSGGGSSTDLAGVVDTASVGRREGRAEYELRGGRSAAAGADLFGVVRDVAGSVGERRAEPIGESGNGVSPNVEGSTDRAQHIHGDDRCIHADRSGAGRVSTTHSGIHCGEESAGSRYGEPERSVTSYWHDAEWIVCHDDKARRTKPGLCDVADGFSGAMDHRGGESDADLQETPYYGLLVKDMIGRVDLWRITGNAIVPEAAKEVIAAFIDVYGLPSEWGR